MQSLRFDLELQKKTLAVNFDTVKAMIVINVSIQMSLMYLMLFKDNLSMTFFYLKVHFLRMLKNTLAT